MFNFLSYINLRLKAKKNLGIFWYSNTGLKWIDGHQSMGKWLSKTAAKIVIPLYPAIV